MSFRELDEPAGYVRQRAFDQVELEATVLRYVHSHGRITRADVEEPCHLPESQAIRLLRKLVADDELSQRKRGRSTDYVLP